MKNNFKYFFVIIAVGILAWYQTLGFWFFKAYEATWLMGWLPHSIVNLIRSHSFLYFLDWKLFGWNPWGWYATSLTLHLIASILLFFLVFLISKNRLLSFISSLFFVASTSYNDVLTWGSFNSYYPFLLIWMLLTLISFYKYKETKSKIFLFLSILFSFLGFFTRETGIVIIPILTIFDIVFSKNLKKETIVEIIKRQISFYAGLIIFFVIRSLYGGTGGDTADSNVKLQMRLVSDGLYLEYAKAAVLTFGKLIPPQIIPYPFLNSIREVFTRFIYYDLVNTYFFPIVGWLFFVGLGVLLVFLRKSREYFRLFLFFWIWIGLFSLFVSLAIPNTPEVLAREYEYNTMRYRYFAFVGMSVALASFLVTILTRKPRLLYLIVSSVVVANLLLLWIIEKKVYVLSYKPAKEFYMKFTSYFPTLPKESVFYLYPHASGLSDYLLEWYLIKDQSYPNLVGQPFRVESQIIAVLDKIKKGKINLDDVFFLDYDEKKGLINRTEDVKKILLNQKEYSMDFKKVKDNLYESSKDIGPNIEIPYNFEVFINVAPKENFVGKQPDSLRFKALVDYSVARNQYLNVVSVDTAYTMSQRAGEPFFHVLPYHLVDGNTGSRYFWIADTFKPWVNVELDKEKEILGVSWGSTPNSTRIPATYSIFTSRDGRSWRLLKSVKNSIKANSIDIFDEPVTAKFVRMEVSTTSGGDFVLLDEFEVLDSSAQKILDYYKDRDQLLNDTYEVFKFVESKEDLEYARQKGLVIHWAKLTWETNKSSSVLNNQYLYFPFNLYENGQVSVELPEGEVYAGKGQLFKKNITSMSLDFGETPFVVETDSLKLYPRMKL